MTMRSIIKGGKTVHPHSADGARPRLDRVAAATCEQLKTALIVLSDFSPDAFDYAMDFAEFGDEDSAASVRDAAPVCAVCGGSIGIFLGRGLDWQHFDGDGTTAGKQRIYDPGHVPVVSWDPEEELQSQQ
jgi:hypothetical protein